MKIKDLIDQLPSSTHMYKRIDGVYVVMNSSARFGRARTENTDFKLALEEFINENSPTKDVMLQTHSEEDA